MAESGELTLPFLERLAMAVLRRTRAHAPVAGEDDPIHVLNEAERRELHRIEQRAVARAAVAGALSGGARCDGARVHLRDRLSLLGRAALRALDGDGGGAALLRVADERAARGGA